LKLFQERHAGGESLAILELNQGLDNTNLVAANPGPADIVIPMTRGRRPIRGQAIIHKILETFGPLRFPTH
jgi:hypothetical protein